MSNKRDQAIYSFLGGLAGGICLSLFIAVAWFSLRIGRSIPSHPTAILTNISPRGQTSATTEGIALSPTMSFTPLPVATKSYPTALPPSNQTPHPQWTLRPVTPTPQWTPTSTPSPTSTLGISYPYNVNHAIVVDLSAGLGAFTLPSDDQYLLTAYDWPLFRFQPVEPIPIKDVKSLVIHLIPADDETGDPPSEIQLWVPREGRVDQLFSPVWGDNVIEHPSKYPLPDGDVFFYIANGPSEVRLKDLAITLVVETRDGKIQTYGPK